MTDIPQGVNDKVVSQTLKIRIGFPSDHLFSLGLSPPLWSFLNGQCLHFYIRMTWEMWQKKRSILLLGSFLFVLFHQGAVLLCAFIEK